MRSTLSYRQKPQCPRSLRRRGGHALILTLSLLPLLAWLSWDMLSRATHLTANGAIYTEISALRAAAWRDLADAITMARRGVLQTGTTRARRGNITVTRSIADLFADKANTTGAGLTGYVIDSVASADHATTVDTNTAITLRMSFLFRANDLPTSEGSHGGWHVLAP